MTKVVTFFGQEVIILVTTLVFAEPTDVFNTPKCTSQAKVDTQTRKYTPKLFGRAFDIVLESDNSMRTQDVLRCRT